MKTKAHKYLSRRDFLNAAAAGGFLAGFGQTQNGLFVPKAYAQGTGANPFLLVIHVGSPEAMAFGLNMAHYPDQFPEGIFDPNAAPGTISATDKYIPGADPGPVNPNARAKQISWNPHLNNLTPHGAHIYNNYTAPLLKDIASDIFFATGFPQKFDHDTAPTFQLSGGDNGRQPGWTTGFAEAFARVNGSISESVFTWASSDGGSVEPTLKPAQNTLVSHVGVNALSRGLSSQNLNLLTLISEMVAKYQLAGSQSGTTTVGLNELLTLQGQLSYNLQHSFSRDTDSFRSVHKGALTPKSTSGGGGSTAAPSPQMVSALSGINVTQFNSNGLTIGAGSPTIGGINSETIKSHLSRIADTRMLGLGEKSLDSSSIAAFVNGLQVAAFLAKSGMGRAFHLGQSFLPNFDCHGSRSDNVQFGGGDGHHSYAGAIVWAGIRTFWDWVKAEGLQNQVCVVVVNEFSRTPYTTYESGRVSNINFKVGSQTLSKSINDPASEHGAYFNMAIINGKVPRVTINGVTTGGRIGGIKGRLPNTDSELNARPVGTKTLAGIPDTTVPAYTAMDIMGSMLRKIFPQVFPSEASVKAIWPNYVLHSNVENQVQSG